MKWISKKSARSSDDPYVIKTQHGSPDLGVDVRDYLNNPQMVNAVNSIVLRRLAIALIHKVRALERQLEKKK